ncbi:hypothetical protein [Streptomyces sp. NBC_01408]|uniref:hypothetical protein n=1 Tax=Streptomyces sp. NBC_01408 TaxID=2903855 RepID=UPI00224FAFCE|nr:hypothetical protein [Streptomyces sp. NBC_01408]MCX4695265.1 hypothetical protein [Streptomyces sp. NBC_01408]
MAVAVLVYFRKVSEDAERVTYAFGGDPDAFTRRLAMAVAGSRTAVPDDGRVDHLFLKASRKINAMREESGRWPERGMSAS